MAVQGDELDQNMEIVNEFGKQLKDKQLEGSAEYDSCTKWITDERL